MLRRNNYFIKAASAVRKSTVLYKFLSIIAFLGLALHAGAATSSSLSAVASTASGFAAYEVELKIVRNGIELGRPSSTVVVGESSSLNIATALPSAPVRLNQRVTAFPGASRFKALLQLELYTSIRGFEKRLAAPTLGVELGEAQVFELNTEQGRISIRALVTGLKYARDKATSSITTIAYPEI